MNGNASYRPDSTYGIEIDARNCDCGWEDMFMERSSKYMKFVDHNPVGSFFLTQCVDPVKMLCQLNVYFFEGLECLSYTSTFLRYQLHQARTWFEVAVADARKLLG